jgi:hypothetical protein
MMNIQNLVNTPKRVNKIKPSDIRNLVENSGKATINNKNMELRNPYYADFELQKIVNDGSMTIELLDTPTLSGIKEYELHSDAGSIKVKIYCPHCK